MLSTRFRMTLALCLAVASLAIVVAPTLAETVQKGCHGTCGSWQVNDMSTGQKGAVCVYPNKFPYNLDEITIRPPLMHGAYATKSRVGWRFNAQRQGVSGGSWHTIYTSSYQTANADDMVPAYVGHGFARRAWDAPKDPSGYRYRVQIDMKWWKGSSVKGTLTLKYDWYKAQRGGAAYTNQNYCLQSY